MIVIILSHCFRWFVLQQWITRALGTHPSRLHFPDSRLFTLCSLFLRSQSSSHTCCLQTWLAVLSRASKPLSLPFPLPGPFIFPSPLATLSYLRMSPRPSSETSHSRGLSPPQFGLATAPHPHEVSHGSVLIFMVVLTTLPCNGPILAFS